MGAELKTTLISMVQQSQFGGILLEVPNLHLSVFLEMYDTLKLNEVPTDLIWLWLFPFTLTEKVRAWLHYLAPLCITTWDELTKIFLAKFFPSRKTASLRNQITTYFSKGRPVALGSLGVVQGPIEAISTSWALVMNDNANLLQWSHSTSEIYHRCSSRWHSNKQNGRLDLQPYWEDGA